MTVSNTAVSEFEAEIARHYNRNFLAGLLHGIFFQMSAAFGSIHTVLPAFVILLTPSTAAVGLMAAVQGVGGIIPQIFTAYLFEDKPRKKIYLLGAIVTRALSWFFLAWLTYAYGLTYPTLILAVLITLFGIFSLAGGVGTIAYADIFGRAIPADRRGRFAGARQIGGFALAILAGWIVKLILADGTRFPFPANYSLIFLLSAITLSIAFIGFAMIREPVYPVTRQSESFSEMMHHAKILIRKNANFQRLLLSQAILSVGIGLAPFFVVHAKSVLDLSAGTIGIFLSAQMAGAALSNVLWAWLADKYGNKSVIIGVMASSALTSLLAIVLPQTFPMAYSLVFVLVGAMLSGISIGYENFILEMASPNIRSTCVALKHTLLIPMAVFPLVAGVLLEDIPFNLVFGSNVVLASIGILLAFRLIDPRHSDAGKCLEDICD